MRATWNDDGRMLKVIFTFCCVPRVSACFLFVMILPVTFFEIGLRCSYVVIRITTFQIITIFNYFTSFLLGMMPAVFPIFFE